MSSTDPTTAQHLFTTAHLILAAFAGSGIGITAGKYLSKIVKAMPPLPPDASWGKQWLYAALKAITEAEPNGSAK